MNKDNYLGDLDYPPDWITNPPPEIVKGSARRGNLVIAPTHSVHEATAHARAVLDKVSSELANETRGGRNDMLNKHAHTMGGFVASGAIVRDEAEASLRNACRRNGLMEEDAGAVEATLKSGLDVGATKPISFEPGGEIEDWDNEPVALPPTSDACLADLTRPPGLVGEIVDWIEASSEFPSRELALGAALGWVATLAGRGFETPSRARTNLYMVALAPSGYGKDHAGSCIVSLATATGLDRFIGPARFMSASALRETLMRQASILSIQDEFGGILKQIDGPRVGIHNEMIRFDMLGLFSRAKDLYGGAAYANNGAVKLFNPNFSIYGMSTPSEFWSAVTSSRNADGFLPRFILFNVDSPKPQRVKPVALSGKPPQSIINRSRDLYLATYGSGNLAVAHEGGVRAHVAKVVSLSDDATAALVSFEARIEEALTRAEAKREPFLNRAREHALKLALTVAVGVNPKRPVIDRVAMDWAIALAWVSTCTLIREGESMIADNDRQRTFNRIVDIVRKAGADGIPKGRFLDRLGATVKRSEREELLDEAIQMGRMRLQERIPEGLGRPSKRYVHRDFW